jgi:tRNA-specific 2-thiouridylase
MNSKKIVVGLSGGVDSATSAYLLKEQGYELIGIYMRNWHQQGSQKCPIEDDLKDAKASADFLGIPFEVVDFSEQYMNHVFEQFLSDLSQGLTPNPDVLCNQYVKFEAFLNHITSTYGASLATGHYAQINHQSDGAHLMMAKDSNKDQTYFLCRLTEQQLSQSHFPIGHLSKPEVRKIAEKINLPVSQKKDSTGICFIGERNFNRFITQYLLDRPGPIIDIDTHQTLTTHQGLIHYTIGQRKGISIPAKNENAAPWFVVKKDINHQAIYVCQGDNHPALYQKSLFARDLHLIHPVNLNHLNIQTRIRHRQPLQNATITTTERGIKVDFETPQRAITPGQYIALYQNEELLGSAIIESSDD